MPADTDQYHIHLTLSDSRYYPAHDAIAQQFPPSDIWCYTVTEIQEVPEPIIRHPKDGP